MKTLASNYFLLIVIGAINVIFNPNQLFAQYTPLSKVGGDSSLIIQYDNWQVHRLGIGTEFTNGTYYPRAWFHQKERVLEAIPISMFEGMNETYDTSTCSMKFIFKDGNIKYNIYQSGLDYINYFDGAVGSGNQFYVKGNYPLFKVIGEPEFPFIMTPANEAYTTTPLTLYRERKVKVQDTLECNNFLLHYNAGLNKLLISDGLGNGNWVDPSLYNDHKWLVNSYNDLYSSPDRNHIGIGFGNGNQKIYQKLHIVDGNILISRINDVNPISVNGSILFGDNQVNDAHPNGNWGIEYFNGGLNFWKVIYANDSPSTTTQDRNYHLFLKDDGTVGIGCHDTRGYQLAVKGNILCEEVLVRKYLNWPDFVFDNEYKLMPLNELEAYTISNKHLPEMPTAQEVQENGVNLGDVSATLLKKVEELTRYIFDQQKEIDALKAAIINN